jgi:hypothetical protein
MKIIMVMVLDHSQWMILEGLILVTNWVQSHGNGVSLTLGLPHNENLPAHPLKISLLRIYIWERGLKWDYGRE